MACRATKAMEYNPSKQWPLSIQSLSDPLWAAGRIDARKTSRSQPPLHPQRSTQN